MKTVISLFFSILVASAMLAPQFSSAATTSSENFVQLAQQAQPQHPQLALFYLGQALVATADKPPRFGPLQSRYWALVAHTGAFSQAVNLYARLKLEHPKNPNVLAGYANAVGGLLGWLYGGSVPPPSGLIQKLNHSAMDSYDRALKIQPDNFSALLGRSIYVSHAPGGMPKAEAGFKHILTLRKTHPHYPYAVVYTQWAAALERNGQKAQAEKIMQQGHAKLGDAAFAPHHHP